MEVERDVLILRSGLGKHGVRLSDFRGMRAVDVILGLYGVDVRGCAMRLHLYVAGHVLS